MPYAYFYTLIGFFFQHGPFPFHKKKVFYIKNGVKRPPPIGWKEKYQVDKYQDGCNIEQRYRVSYVAPKKEQVSYVLKNEDRYNLRTIDTKKPHLFCSERDLLGGNLYIINKLEYGEALETFLKPENKEEVLEMRVLVYPSEEINKNLMRLFSIIPLLLQANQLKLLSIIFSISIIVVDLLSNILEKRCWIPTKLKLKDYIRWGLTKVKSRSQRSAISKYLSSISLSLLHSDNFTCNFKRVVPGEKVWIMPNSYLDGFKNYCRAPLRIYDMVLVEEDASFIKKHNEGQRLVGRDAYFSIRDGSLKYTVITKQGELKCIFVLGDQTRNRRGMAYNFLDDVELHWGPYFQPHTSRIISFLNEIARLDYLPFTMSIKNHTYQLEGYDRVFHHVAWGGWFLTAEAIHGGFVA
ncbi:hypothetical protein KC19_11G099000 [Ceratodon purpureus]|uniref:Uncharacterized protein n=1 Tax=Ceratodon purpureus TaxID=3225 RepID=A0A8T0GFV5_CERPU|nr:hypothetical protein KC19_11G099000 [Ceratodon purpureus]